MTEQNNKPRAPRAPRPPRQASGGQRGQQPRRGGQNNKQQVAPTAQRSVSRGAAIRAQKRNNEMATKMASQYLDAAAKNVPRRANVIDDSPRLKISFLGGQEGIGEKNMQIIEWKNDAIILDCGIELGIDLPGVNYGIADTTYLESIKHKLRGYVISHGHLDHVGGLKHIAPRFPAPIYGSRFTIGVIEKTFEDVPADLATDFEPQLIVMNMDNHERLMLGAFTIELVRITHSIPESSAIVVDTPVGRIINTGDWRLDPEPLDHLPTDVARLRQLGEEGVLLLMSDSTGAAKEGRTPTEHTLQDSFYDLIEHAEGRVFCAIFSSNMNRIQMIVNAAVRAGRRVAIDGRSMMSYAEIAVRQGILKIPAGTVLAMRDMANVPDDQVLVVCTGGQGEPGAALQRMADGDHKHIKLHEGDTVIISSTPIPGNEIRYAQISAQIADKGAHLYRHVTHNIDGCGPLHVSGHGAREEYAELIRMIKPKYFLPIYADSLNRKYHHDLAIQDAGMARANVLTASNGQTLFFTDDKCEHGDEIPHGTVLVDQTGAIVSNVVVKDRIMMSQDGIVAVVLTVDRKTGQSMTSPDIISRGFIYMRDNEELMNELRAELKRAVQQRFKRIDLDRFKAEIKDHVTHFLYDKTQRSPIVIPVINVIGGGRPGQPGAPRKTDEELKDEAAIQARRFAEMRAQLLGQDQRD